jgi:hypothetical protein
MLKQQNPFGCRKVEQLKVSTQRKSFITQRCAISLITLCLPCCAQPAFNKASKSQRKDSAATKKPERVGRAESKAER